ncbi:helix-hairpin-helix domain-containing protein [Bacteroidales bacterium OttesenSCG-928-I14]|nr:helix-hairpin-helix domain-containing protein [Bacteroidales bacterium OttesenSCG-928-I14]
MSWKDFFYFTKREKRGILLLIVFIIGVFVGKWLFTPAPIPPIEVQQENTNETVNQAIASNKNYTTNKETEPEKDIEKKVYNKKVRTKRTELPPPEQRTYYPQKPKDTIVRTAPKYPVVEKYPEGTVISLNFVDTTELKKIPGIGSSYAKRIVGYRNLLGGFYRMEQLQEVYGMYEELYEKISPYFLIETDSLRLITVNKSSIDKLKAHPYINFYQAKAIVEIRKKKDRLESINDLILLEEFTDDDWLRLTPYLSFE